MDPMALGGETNGPGQDRTIIHTVDWTPELGH
jgi:hypothetical protein